MAIWDQLLEQELALETAVNPDESESEKKEIIKQEENKSEYNEALVKQEDDLQKIFAMNPFNQNMPYRIGSTKSVSGQRSRLLSKGVTYYTLRDLSIFYTVLRACINYRKREMTKQEWDIVAVEPPKTEEEKKKIKADADEVRKAFRHPTGDKNLSFRDFLNKIIEDVLVLDAIAIYRRKNRKGGIFGYLPIDASTIELIITKNGTIPIPPSPAYVQVIDGKDVERLSTDDLIYRMLNPRTYSPYGLSPVETLVITISTALRVSTYNLAYISEGNIPEGFVELPKDIASSPDQLKLWQEAWDAMIAGKYKFQRKIKFLPEGMKWHPVKKSEDMEFERFEEWLLLNTCSVMEVPPQSIGFQFDRGKGATEAEWEIGKERSAFPTANFLSEIFDDIIQEDMKMPHLRFNWTNINPTNKKEEAEVFGMLVKSGAVSVDEWRIAEGYDPIGLDQYMMTPVGPISVKDFVKLSEAGQNPFIPPKPEHADSDLTPPGFAKPKKPTSPTKPTQAKLALVDGSISRKEVREELKRWRKAATNDIISGKQVRNFKTEIVDYRTQQTIRDGLNKAKNKQEVYDLFNVYISREGEMLSAVLDLYDEINTVVGYNANEA